MQDKELYQQILGFSSPWKVTDIELDFASSGIRAKVDHPGGSRFYCPECKTELSCHDHAEERGWRHLDSCQFETILIACQPRVNCPENGVKTVSVPWAGRSSCFTLMFVRFVIDVLLATQTVEGVCVLLRTTWDEAWSILQKALVAWKGP
jgi:transposase